MHNVYMGFFDSLREPKIEFRHDISQNALVYFSMFCDNLQIWDRPFSVSHGTVIVDKPAISNKEISLKVFDNRINVFCRTFGIEDTIRKYKTDLDRYLNNGSRLISLGVYEE